jgi:uncharacterized protein YggE
MPQNFSRLKLLFALGFALWAAPAFAQTPPQMLRMITVSGEAEEQASPDRAILTVSLVSKNKDLSAAKSENDAMVEKLVAISRDFKIAKEKVATSNVQISPEYNYDKGKQQFIGYQVSRNLRITMDDITIQERVLSAIVDAKIDQVNGVEFTLADPEARAKNVRVKAVENAHEKAAALATAAGAKLGQVIAISTTGDNVMPPPRPMMMKAMMDSAAGQSSVAPSLPGMITLHESVTVSYALE